MKLCRVPVRIALVDLVGLRTAQVSSSRELRETACCSIHVSVLCSCPVKERRYSFCDCGVLDPVVRETSNCFWSDLIRIQAWIRNLDVVLVLTGQNNKVVVDILYHCSNVVEPGLSLPEDSSNNDWVSSCINEHDLCAVYLGSLEVFVSHPVSRWTGTKRG